MGRSSYFSTQTLRRSCAKIRVTRSYRASLLLAPLLRNTNGRLSSVRAVSSFSVSAHHPQGNSNNPDFLQTERVDIYLFHGDSLEQILAIPNQVNPRGQAGSVSRQVNDLWWGTRGVDWGGSNISYPFYWLIARHGESLDDGTLKPQATFSAVRKCRHPTSHFII